MNEWTEWGFRPHIGETGPEEHPKYCEMEQMTYTVLENRFKWMKNSNKKFSVTGIFVTS